MDSKKANRDLILNELWSSYDLSNVIKKMEPVELQDDLRQELFVVLCEMDEVKLIGLHERGELKWFVVGVIRNMIQSNRSAFYRTHRKFNEQVLNDAAPDDLPDVGAVNFIWADVVNGAIAELDPYEENMIRLYSEMNRNCERIAAATGIQARSVRYVVTQAKQKLQKRLKQHVD